MRVTAPTAPEVTALAKLEARMRSSESLLCVGLDPALGEPSTESNAGESGNVARLCCEIVEQTAPYACAFKLNTAFFEARGAEGWRELDAVMTFLRQNYRDHFTICDAKRGDIGNTNQGYVRAIFDDLGADAVTLHPYLGAEALEPFLARTDKVSIILCRTSNTGAGELQDLLSDGEPLWLRVAERVSQHWNTRGNCMLVVGATWPEEMRRLRETAPELPFLVPGIGAQGGDIDATVRAGLRKDGLGLLLSSSRGIFYAADPAQAAREAQAAINEARRLIHAD